MKQFFEHYSGIKIASDGEVLVPKSGANPEHQTYGYLKTRGYLNTKYKGKSWQIHKLVAEVFLNDNKPIPEGFQIHHINRNKMDNRPENLRIISFYDHIQLHKNGYLEKEINVEFVGKKGKITSFILKGTL